MTMIDSATGWLYVVKITMFDLKEVPLGNDEYIDKSSARDSQMFKNTWLCIYPCPHKVVLDNGSDFKRYFTPLLMDLDIKHFKTSVKNPQANAPVERVHKVILNMLVTKDIDNKVFDYIDPWDETLASIAWVIRASYHSTIMVTAGKAIFDIDMLSNLASVVDWQVATAAKQCQVDIDNVPKNAKLFTHEYDIGDRVHVEITDIHCKFDYKQQGPYRITEVFTNGTVRVQCRQVNERMNIRRLKPHFNE